MEFITGKHISRREVLRGLGVTVALPFLDAMVPAGRLGAMARANSATDRTRLVAIEMVHGAAGSNEYGASMNRWSPATVGREFDLTPGALSSLEPYRDYLTIISNTDVEGAEAITAPEIGGDHFRSSATFLTQAHPKQTEGSDVYVGDVARPVLRPAIWSGYAHPIDATVYREHRPIGRMCVRIHVCLHGLDQLGVACRAASRDP